MDVLGHEPEELQRLLVLRAQLDRLLESSYGRPRRIMTWLKWRNRAELRRRCLERTRSQTLPGEQDALGRTKETLSLKAPSLRSEKALALSYGHTTAERWVGQGVQRLARTTDGRLPRPEYHPLKSGFQLGMVYRSISHREFVPPGVLSAHPSK